MKKNILALIAGVSLISADPSVAQETESLFGTTSASVTFGPYLRVEAGSALTTFGDPNWLPPGPGDPRVFFDFDDDRSGLGALALGYDWMNGFRADASLIFAGKADATGPWSRTVPATPGPHANISDATVETTAVMGSVFYSPLEQRGVNMRVQPYLVAGLGVANNKLSDWTRTNAAAARPTRTFEGNSDTDFAFSVGLGVSWQVSKPGQRPVLLDFAYRYYDFGSVSGGRTSLAGGSSSPREALNFDRRDKVLSVGLRIPLTRY